MRKKKNKKNKNCKSISIKWKNIVDPGQKYNLYKKTPNHFVMILITTRLPKKIQSKFSKMHLSWLLQKDLEQQRNSIFKWSCLRRSAVYKKEKLTLKERASKSKKNKAKDNNYDRHLHYPNFLKLSEKTIGLKETKIAWIMEKNKVQMLDLKLTTRFCQQKTNPTMSFLIIKANADLHSSSSFWTFSSVLSSISYVFSSRSSGAVGVTSGLTSPYLPSTISFKSSSKLFTRYLWSDGVVSLRILKICEYWDPNMRA